jgi:hypothetical protein
MLVGLRADAQNHDLRNLITGIAFVVLDWRHDLPDDPIPIAPCVNSETALPLRLQGVTQVGCSLQAVEQAAWPLDLTVGPRVLVPEAPQVRPGLGCQGYFVSLCRGKVLPARAFFLALLSRSTSAGSALISSVIRRPTARASGRAPP